MIKGMDPDPDPQHCLELRQNLDLIVQASYFELETNVLGFRTYSLFSVQFFRLRENEMGNVMIFLIIKSSWLQPALALLSILIVPLLAVVRIHDILVWIRIRIRGSMALTNGSGSGSWIRILLFARCLLFFEGTFTSFFKDKKFKRSNKTVSMKGSLTIFACW